jgi:hypothetical protein
MIRKVFLALVALVIAANVHILIERYQQSERTRKPVCLDEYDPAMVVGVKNIATGEVGTGVVLDEMATDEGKCLFLVRGSYGVEMAFLDWYESHEIFAITE